MFSLEVGTGGHRAIHKRFLWQSTRHNNSLSIYIYLNLSSLFMEGYSGGILFGVLSCYGEIMSIFPNQWFCLDCSMSCITILIVRHLLFYYLKRKFNCVLEKSYHVNSNQVNRSLKNSEKITPQQIGRQIQAFTPLAITAFAFWAFLLWFWLLGTVCTFPVDLLSETKGSLGQKYCFPKVSAPLFT